MAANDFNSALQIKYLPKNYFASQRLKQCLGYDHLGFGTSKCHILT
jgi:hypothetical protein